MAPLITNDAVVLGILLVILAGVFYTSNSERPLWKKVYKYVPAILLCLWTYGTVESSNLGIEYNSGATWSIRCATLKSFI